MKRAFKISKSTQAFVDYSFTTLNNRTFICGAVFSKSPNTEALYLDASILKPFNVPREDEDEYEEEQVMSLCRDLLKKAYRKDKPKPTVNKRSTNIYGRRIRSGNRR